MINVVKSKAISLNRADVDTDLIIPAEFLTVTDKNGLGQHVFARLRQMDGDFGFNRPECRDREILIAGDNFGCGSSREHAAWALHDWGIRVIIAPSFADIFKENSMKNGLLPIEMDVDGLMGSEEEIVVNLPEQTVNERHFEIDPYRKECLIKGMDDLDYLFANMRAIEEFDRERARYLFFDISKI